MNTTVWDADFVYKGPMAVRVSCHPGDFGTKVICNAVGDQPLFYMDDANVDEDDMMMDYISDATLLEMEAKLQTYDRAIQSLSDIEIEPTQAKFNKMVETPAQEYSVNDIIEFGCESGLFKSYLEFIRESKIEITSSSVVETAYFNKEKNEITVNPHLDKVAGGSALICAMRMAWNYKQGILINPLTFQPEETVLINRLFAADQDITKISFIWDLKLAGYDQVWSNAMSGSDYDLYSAYSIEAMADFRSIKNGLASRATFEKWFMSDRCKNYDRQIIQVMLGNHAKFQIDEMNTSRLVAMDIVSRLGNRPIGKNYLTLIVSQIMNDSLYCEIRDRSNANFLWFVSFEKRMSQMEAELQEEEQTLSSRSGTDNNEDNVYELPIINGSERHSADTDGMATLFVLDHFRAG